MIAAGPSRKQRYYTLVAGLPALPPRLLTARSRRLPINQERLDERLRMLEPDDAEVMLQAENFLEWHRQPVGRTDAEVAARYRRIQEGPFPAALKEMVGERLTLRTLMAALRRRHLGRPAPVSGPAGEPWGVGPWVRHIEQHWGDPDFKLRPLFPFLPKVRAALEKGDPLAVERLVLDVVWKSLGRYGERDAFSFDAVLAYRFRWDILARWLAFDAQVAQNRFESLVHEVIDEHIPSFAA
jgi:hypothetical protein